MPLSSYNFCAENKWLQSESCSAGYWRQSPQRADSVEKLLLIGWPLADSISLSMQGIDCDVGTEARGARRVVYEFSIDDHVPQDHLLRSIDRFVDLSGIRQHLAPFYSNTGRPSIVPELLIQMLLVGYCIGIRSERRLCEEVHLNLAFRWLCRLDLSDHVPDHSTFSKNHPSRQIALQSPSRAMHGRFRDSDLLRHLFETTVARCISEGLVSGQRFSADASLIEADANKQNSTSKEDWNHSTIEPADAARAVKEYLEVLDDAAFGAASEVDPKFTSHSDPSSQCLSADCFAIACR